MDIKNKMGCIIMKKTVVRVVALVIVALLVLGMITSVLFGF